MRRPVAVAMTGVSVVVVGAAYQESTRTHATTVVRGVAPVGVVAAPALTSTAAPVVTHPPRRALPRTTSSPAPAATAVRRVHHDVRPAASPSPRPTPSPTPVTVAVNGPAVDTRYGPVQVQVRIRGHRIVGADAVEYPQDTGRDQEINSYAIPQLDQETLQAQSAQIDTVSGATYTSEGYISSLQAALDQAHRAGIF